MQPWRRALAADGARKAAPGWGLAGFCMALAAASFALAALVLWPTRGEHAGQDLRLVVLDASASVARIRSGWAGRSGALLREQAQAALAEGQAFAVVTAAPQAQRRWGPGPPADFLQAELEGSLHMLRWAPVFGEDLVTDWEGTLQLLHGFAEDESVGRYSVVLYTDGQARDERAWQGLAHLASMGCELRYGDLPAATQVDVALVSLHLPTEMPPGVPGSVRIRLAWRGAGVDLGSTWPWKVTVSNADGIVSEVVGQLPAIADGVEGSWSSRVQNLPLPPLAAGVYQVRVELDGVPTDRALENQGRSDLLRVGQELQVLLVGTLREPGDGERTARELSSAGVACRAVAAQDLPEWLGEAHCVVTLGLSPSELPGQALQDFVERGGSWLALGEENMLAGWSGRSILTEADLGGLLPLSLDRGDGPEKDVILLVDGSGSMQGEPWSQVQAATLVLLRNVSRQAGFEVDLFTNDLLPAALALPPQAADADGTAALQTERAMRAFLQARIPGGRTNIFRSIESLLERRAQKGPCKVVLITDGWQNDGGSWDPDSLRVSMAGAQMELSIVATSENPNLADLGRLIPRESIVLAKDLEGLAEILKQELMGEAVRRDAGMRIVGAGFGVGAIWGLPDLLPEGSAPVGSLLKTKARGGARVLLQTVRAEPVLAAVQRGRGLVAQVTSLAGADFLWSGAVSLRSLVGSLAQAASSARAGQAGLVEFEGEYFLVGAWDASDVEPRLELRLAGQEQWTRVPLILGLGLQGLDARDWLGLDLESALPLAPNFAGARWRLLREGAEPLQLALPQGAPLELLPGGHSWPRSLPKAVLRPESGGQGVHRAGPIALIIGMFSLVLGLGFRALAGR